MPTVVEQQDRASIGNNIQNEQSAMNEAELFIENMQLTEPMKFMQVPNHLLETSKIRGSCCIWNSCEIITQ